jgi:hypothetical protein
MDTDIIMNFRNVMLVGAILSTATCFPDLASSCVRPLLKLRSWFKRCRASLRVRLQEKRASGFWEIDMTKFEP